MRLLHVLIIACLVSNSAVAGETIFRSGPARVHLLELYTSEGCSSCPPAEERFSRFQSDPALWIKFVPVAFHVDYWDNLGWPDRFAFPVFTQRQRDYAALWGANSVYTPEFVVDGRESRGGDLPASDQSGGNLVVTVKAGGFLTIKYTPAQPTVALEVHIAALGMGIESDVRSGENGGHRLRHDFIVLRLTGQPLVAEAESARATARFDATGAKAIAVWISGSSSPFPLQATGGWLR